jgi:hypothetical protein
LGEAKIGKYYCPNCGYNFDEDKSFWEKLKNEFFSALGKLTLLMAAHRVSLDGMTEILEMIFPCSKSQVANIINSTLDELPEDIFAKLPEGTDYIIIFYDEQCVKVNGREKYRLTLLNQNGEVIGEQLFDFLMPEAIFFFFCEYLDPKRPTFIVTDCDPTYPAIFEAFFGRNYIHQLCLFHLNKLIVKDFPRNGTITDEYLKYQFLNIFYNREKELVFIKALLDEELKARADPNIDCSKWLKRSRRKIRKYIHELKKERRRAGENLPQRSLKEASMKMRELINKYNDFPEHLQKRLRMIADNWEKFTAFYKVQDAPRTNNKIENYFSRSAKTDRKKQFRGDIGVETRLKLTILRINGFFASAGISLFELYMKFQPFRARG